MSNKMWGGRFSSAPTPSWRRSTSPSTSTAPAAYDIAASQAPARRDARGEPHYFGGPTPNNIAKGLRHDRAQRWDKGSFQFRRALEDIHMTIESRLAELIGPAAGRLHTARSRNDQVATDFRLWVRDAIDQADAGLAALQRALVTRAGEHAARIMPGFTHLQTAQPVTLGHHLHGLLRDGSRAIARALPMRARGSTEVPAGRRRRWPAPAFRSTGTTTAKALGFDRADRQQPRCGVGPRFRARLPDGAAQCALHLSRLAEEFIIWASQPFGFVRLPDSAFHRQLDHAAEEEPRRGRTGARPCRADRRLPHRADGDDEGPAARLFEGHAGRQAAGVRGRRRCSACRSRR